MAAPCAFDPWLEGQLEALGLDGDVYGGYVKGLLREAESDAERLEGLAGALAAGEQVGESASWELATTGTRTQPSSVLSPALQHEGKEQPFPELECESVSPPTFGAILPVPINSSVLIFD